MRNSQARTSETAATAAAVVSKPTESADAASLSLIDSSAAHCATVTVVPVESQRHFLTGLSPPHAVSRPSHSACRSALQGEPEVSAVKAVVEVVAIFFLFLF